MRAFDVLFMCLRNLYKRKLRTFLTLLGVMIGTGSIILMISLGLATNAQFAQMIENMNIDMTVIRVWPQWDGMMWSPDGGMQEMERKDLTDESADRIARLRGVTVATPMVQGWFLFRSGPYAMFTSVTGIRPEALEHMGFTLEYGRMLGEGDGTYAAVFNTYTERGFFDTMSNMGWSDRQWNFSDDVPTLVDIFGDTIRIYYDDSSMRGRGWDGDDFGTELDDTFTQVRSFELDIVGVIQLTEMDMMWGNAGNTIYVSLDTVQSLNQMREDSWRREMEEGDNPHFSAVQGGPRQTYDELYVRVASIDDTRRVAEEIREMGYQVHFQGDWIEQQRDMQRGVQTLLAAIAAVSLAVAAINIANTMITSVTERTREIGVMKVIGAAISDILKLFLLESVVIGFLGGLFGVGLALGFSYAMNNYDIAFFSNLNMGVPDWMLGMTGTESVNISLITPWLCGLALAVACGVGLVSGFYPAWRATRLSALAAIRGD